MKRTAGGFTLVEIVVALSITLLLAATMLVVVRGLLNVWHRSQGRGVGAIEAKLALDQLERDVQAAILRSDGRGWMDVRVVAEAELPAHGWQVVAARLKPVEESRRLTAGEADAAIDAARFGRAGAWLRMVTSDYDSEAGASQPVAVSYQMARRAVSSGAEAPVRYALFREKLSARDTFDDVLGSGFSAGSPAALTNADNNDVLASNVVDFGVWVFTRDATGKLMRLFPTSNAVPATGQFPSAGEAAVVDVMIRVLSDEGAALVQAMEEGRVSRPVGTTDEAWWWEIVEAHSSVFVRRIELKARAW